MPPSETAIERCLRSFLVKPRTTAWILALGLAFFGGADFARAQPQELAFISDRDGNWEIYTINFDGSGLYRLTYHPGADFSPSYSPDGQHIAFGSDRTGIPEIYVMNSDGTNVAQRTFNSGSVGATWSPDGTMLAFAKVSDGSMNLWKVGAFSGSATPLYAAPGYDSEPDWSPDGTKLALTSDANMFDFVTDIFVVGADGSGFDGLTGDIPDGYDFVAPAWSPDGTKLSMMRHGSDGKEGYETSLVVMDADGANLAPLTAAAEYSRSSWSPDGERIAFNSTSNSVDWIDKDGGSTHVLIPNARNADWRPVPAPVSAPSAGPAAEFRALTSPARGIVRFAVGAQSPGAVLAIHDVAGRRVDAVPLGADASMVTWDPGRCGCGAGVYFARLQPASSAARSVRFVMLR